MGLTQITKGELENLHVGLTFQCTNHKSEVNYPQNTLYWYQSDVV